MKDSGFEAIVVTGKSEKPVYLFIKDGKAELRDASALWGKVTGEVDRLVKEELGDPGVEILQCGPAGENLVLYSSVMSMSNRAAGRTGMGAVMGAKRLKAIACAGGAPIELAEPKSFHQKARRQYDLLDESILKVGYEAFGTNMVSDMVNVRGGYPTNNWQFGQFEEIEAVGAQGLTDAVFVEGVKCFACPVACGRGTEIREGRWKRT